MKNVGTTASAPLRKACSTEAMTSCWFRSPVQQAAPPGDPLHPPGAAGERAGGERGEAATEQEGVHARPGQAPDQLQRAFQLVVVGFLDGMIQRQHDRRTRVGVEQPGEAERLPQAQCLPRASLPCRCPLPAACYACRSL